MIHFIWNIDCSSDASPSRRSDWLLTYPRPFVIGYRRTNLTPTRKPESHQSAPLHSLRFRLSLEQFAHFTQPSSRATGSSLPLTLTLVSHSGVAFNYQSHSTPCAVQQLICRRSIVCLVTAILVRRGLFKHCSLRTIDGR